MIRLVKLNNNYRIKCSIMEESFMYIFHKAREKRNQIIKKYLGIISDIHITAD